MKIDDAVVLYARRVGEKIPRVHRNQIGETIVSAFLQLAGVRVQVVFSEATSSGGCLVETFLEVKGVPLSHITTATFVVWAILDTLLLKPHSEWSIWFEPSI